MGGFWLNSIAWTLPASKLVLIGALWLRHQQRPAAANLVAVAPELAVAAALVILGRTAERRILRAALLALAAVLAVATWLATAAWAFAGAPVGFALLARLLFDPTILQTAFADPVLRGQLVGWLGGFFVLWSAVAVLVVAARPAAERLPARAVTVCLTACVLAGALVAATRPAAPEGRLALAVALQETSLAAENAVVDPGALAELAAPVRALPSTPSAVSAIENVLVLVLESVRREPGTQLHDGFPEAIHFDRMYAHHPRSVKTLEALLFGLYPSTGLVSSAWAIDHYDVDAIALPRLLAAHGFESHYLASMQLGFDNYGGALAAAGFDSIEVVSSDAPLTWGAAAPELFARVATALEDGARRGRRQLVMAWTAECHMPYDHSGEDAPEADPLRRYRKCQDALARDVRALLRRLDEGGLLRKTLVAVLGDHGQMFASDQPGEWGHGQHVYEPSLRVPLLLFVPGARGRRDPRLFQLVDLPAAILAALDLPVPDAWVGRDLLDAGAPEREFVVALSTLSDGQAAVVRADGRKLVRPGGGEAALVFDLTDDPGERRGTAPDASARLAADGAIAAYERLAASAWESRRRTGEDGPWTFGGAELEARWASARCATTTLTDEGDLRVEPVQTDACTSLTDPFKRQLLRAFDTHAVASGFTLSLTLAFAEPHLGATPPRALAKVWGHEEAFAAPLEPAAAGFQTVTLRLPGPPAETTPADTMVAFVGVDPPADYVVRSVRVEPALDADRASGGKGP
jgi:hypothetical protein